MSWLFTIILGLLVGWLAGIISGSFRRFGTLSNILSGIAGAIIAYWLYVSVFRLGYDVTTVNFFSTAAFIWEVIGAIAWVGIMNLVRAMEVRTVDRAIEEARPARPRYGYEYYDEDEEVVPRRRDEFRRDMRDEETTKVYRRRRRE